LQIATIVKEQNKAIEKAIRGQSEVQAKYLREVKLKNVDKLDGYLT